MVVQYANFFLILQIKNSSISGVEIANPKDVPRSLALFPSFTHTQLYSCIHVRGGPLLYIQYILDLTQLMNSPEVLLNVSSILTNSATKDLLTLTMKKISFAYWRISY